jgi:oxaloacetate decarboxylase alpha subunit
MDAEVKAKILNRRRAKELENFEVPDITLEEVRKQYGGPSLSDEELLLRYYAGPEFVNALKTAPPRKEYLDAKKPLAKLVEQVIRKEKLDMFTFEENFTLAAGNEPSSSALIIPRESRRRAG